MSLDVYLDVQNALAQTIQGNPILLLDLDANGNPVTYNQNGRNYYRTKTVKDETGTLIPSIGLIVEFWDPSFVMPGKLCMSIFSLKNQVWVYSFLGIFIPIELYGPTYDPQFWMSLPFTYIGQHGVEDSKTQWLTLSTKKLEKR